MAISKETWMVDKALTILLWVSRLYGMVPLRFQSTASTTVVYISRPIYYLGILIISLINLIVVSDLIFTTQTVAIKNTSNGNRILLMVNTFITIAVTCHGACCSVVKMRRYLRCTAEINKVVLVSSTALKEHYALPVYKIKNSLNYTYTSGPRQWHVIVLISMSIFYLWILPILDFWERNELFFVDITFVNFILYGSVVMMQLHFVVVSLLINTSFEHINKCLADVSSQISSESHNEYSSPLSRNAISYSYIPVTSINKTIDLLHNVKPGVKMTPRMKLARETRKLSSCFVQTCEVVKELNDIENFYLLVHIVVVSMCIVITFNNLEDVLCCGKDLKYAVMKQYIWFVCHILRVALIVEPCHRIKEEFSQTKIIVAQMMCEVTSEADPLFDATDNFFKQILLHDLSFTVMGICSLGRSIIFTIIGGAITLYIVLLEL